MSVVVRNPSLALAPADDGYLAYDMEHGRLHRLNATAALILELGDGSRSVQSLCAELAGLDSSFEPQVCADWIDDSRRSHLLLPPDTTAHGPPPASAYLSRARDLRDQGLVLAAFVCQCHATLVYPVAASEWMYLGELAHIVGRRDDAREAYERYLTLEPGNAEIEHILTALRDEPPPARAPDRTVQQLYARFADFYESSMCADLSYEAPRLLREAIVAVTGGATDLNVLDLGSGTGLAGREIKPYARRLSGIDLSPEMIERARATGVYDELEVAEITSWLSRRVSDRASGDEYDLVTACDCLIYFGDLAPVVVPAGRLLRSGGWLAFTVERGEHPPFRLTDSGRYNHTAEHIAAVAAEARLSVVGLEEKTLRYEYGEAVTGLVVVLQAGQA